MLILGFPKARGPFEVVYKVGVLRFKDGSFPKLRVFWGGPCNKKYSILGSMLGSSYVGLASAYVKLFEGVGSRVWFRVRATPDLSFQNHRLFGIFLVISPKP